MAHQHIHIHLGVTRDADIKRDAGGRFAASGVEGTSFSKRGEREHSDQAGDHKKVAASLRKQGYTGGHIGTRQGVAVHSYNHPDGNHVMMLHHPHEGWTQVEHRPPMQKMEKQERAESLEDGHPDITHHVDFHSAKGRLQDTTNHASKEDAETYARQNAHPGRPLPVVRPR